MMETFSKDKVVLPNCTSQRVKFFGFFLFFEVVELTIAGQIADFLIEFCL